MDIYQSSFRITSTTNKRIFNIVSLHFINSMVKTVPKTIIDTKWNIIFVILAIKKCVLIKKKKKAI